jgi:glycosyltransferase involved in cell wall biosynthesis
MTPVDVSVVIPTRNRARWLEDCLRTLVTQETSASVEFVIVDDASEDETPSVLESWSARDGRIRPVREERLGRSVALNAGMRSARGRVLLFTDDDVSIDPGWIESYVRLFERHPDVDLAGGAIYPIPKSLAWPPWFSERALVALGSIEFEGGERPLTDRENLWGANMAARRELFDRLGTWDEALGVRGDDHPRNDRPEGNEDTELQIRMLASGGTVWYCPGAVVRHRADVPGPRGCVTKGFANGRNSVLRGRKPSAPREPLRPAHSLTGGVLLASALVRMLWWCGLLRIRTTRTVFERSWLAAWSAGWRLESFVRRGERTAADRAVLGVAWPLSQLARRLAPVHG